MGLAHDTIGPLHCGVCFAGAPPHGVGGWGLWLRTMPKGLKRIYGFGHLHFITFSCYRRLPLLRSARARNIFVRVLREVRDRYGFKLVGYVVMPEHIHLLISEPKVGTPSTAMQMLKQRVSRLLRRRRRAPKSQMRFGDDHQGERRVLWQKRFYDFNVWSRKKKIEKLAYMHMNPVKRGLADHPEQWIWSSYSFYQERPDALITVDRVD